MTVANSANATMRRAAPATRATPAQAAVRATRPVPAHAFDHEEDEFRLDLSDIPRMKESLEIEGLKPSLLSRLFDLVAPLKA